MKLMVGLREDAVIGRAVEADAPRGIARASDEQLLERFVAWGDPVAFETLVVRHGPRVLGVCRRVLGSSQDAEDAFQATFLVLVRKAGSIRERGSLGPWLQGVARRIAMRARARNARRARYERQGTAEAVEEPSNDVVRREVQPIVREELDRLPENYRQALRLCYLQGLTTEEAARRLECPSGTLKWRLARGRELLRERLARRGLGLSALLMVLIPAAEGEAAVPDRLIDATVEVALETARRRALPADGVSPNVAKMVEDAVGKVSPWWRPWVMALVALVGLSASAAGGWAWFTRADRVVDAPATVAHVVPPPAPPAQEPASEVHVGCH
jgi:RNA polymerase sigma factor (sigma-70 family)